MMTSYKTMALLLGALTLSACDKNAVQEITAPSTGAKVKFFNFGINAPGVNFYANDAKVTAVTSATGVESTNGTAYGSAANGGFYSDLTPGAYTFTGKIAATTDKDLVVSRVTGTLETAKSYSVYLSGFYDATAKTVEGFVVADDYPATFDYTQALVRFVNASPNSSPMTLFATNTTTSTESPVGTDVAYKSAGKFVAVPAGVYNLNARTAGSATNVFTRAAVSFIAGRVYTITGRGDITLPTTGTATNRPFLDNTLNR
jgi:hypothetical protein